MVAPAAGMPPTSRVSSGSRAAYAEKLTVVTQSASTATSGVPEIPSVSTPDTTTTPTEYQTVLATTSPNSADQRAR